jgi:hydroxyacylglutathione hydrolase
MGIKLKSFVFNFVSENTYVITFENKHALLIDPGCYTKAEKEVLVNYLSENGLTVKHIWLTHSHVDHVAGLDWACDTFGIIPMVHKAEMPVMQAVPSYAPNFGFEGLRIPEKVEYFSEDTSQLEGVEIDILFTPGHSPGSVCFYFKKHGFLIGGDVLFRESIGRTDLPGGHHQTLLDSIQKQLFVLPDETIVYPGHGPSTTIAHEKQYNPFLS